MRAYEIKLDICFEETNTVGNVYFVNHLRWQGRCRESFLRDKAPDILELLNDDLVLATTHCSCEYLAELFAFDRIAVQMRLAGIVQNRIQLEFEYWRLSDQGEQLVARGAQGVACLRRQGKSTVPTPIPSSLRQALEPYGAETSAPERASATADQTTS